MTDENGKGNKKFTVLLQIKIGGIGHLNLPNKIHNGM